MLLKKTYSIPHNEKVRKFSTFIDDYLEVDHSEITGAEYDTSVKTLAVEEPGA